MTSTLSDCVEGTRFDDFKVYEDKDIFLCGFFFVCFGCFFAKRRLGRFLSLLCVSVRNMQFIEPHHCSDQPAPSQDDSVY